MDLQHEIQRRLEQRLGAEIVARIAAEAERDMLSAELDACREEVPDYTEEGEPSE